MEPPTCRAARDADDGQALGVDISRPLLLPANIALHLDLTRQGQVPK